jgi:predicted nucleotide-binding protein
MNKVEEDFLNFKLEGVLLEAFEELYDTQEKKDHINRLCENIITLPTIKKAIFIGKFDRAKNRINELIDEALKRHYTEGNFPVLVKLKDGNEVDLTEVLIKTLLENKLERHIIYRNIGVGLAKSFLLIIGGFTLIFISRYF